MCWSQPGTMLVLKYISVNTLSVYVICFVVLVSACSRPAALFGMDIWLCEVQIIVKVAIQGERPRMAADCPDGLKRLIQKCWHQDPHQRPSCAEIVKLTDIMMPEDARRAR